MTSPAKFKKDKEIIAEYDTQVKGKERFCFQPFLASLPGDCRSFFAVDVWVGKREIICRLPGICRAFLGVQSWVGFAAPCPSPWGCSCFGGAVFEVSQ